jgi:hypothetical protein
VLGTEIRHGEVRAVSEAPRKAARNGNGGRIAASA